MKTLLLITYILTFCFTSCLNLTSASNSTILKSISNNNQTKKAIILDNDGNATVDNSLQVFIGKFDYKISGNEIGNVFIVDRNHGATGLNLNSINLTWLSDDTLLIDYDKKLRTFTKENKIDNITIIYKER